jgi:hypothetical protein
MPFLVALRSSNRSLLNHFTDVQPTKRVDWCRDPRKALLLSLYLDLLLECRRKLSYSVESATKLDCITAAVCQNLLWGTEHFILDCYVPRKPFARRCVPDLRDL